ncbi:RelE family toxin-antitoxin system [Klebsiella pneumoniae]|uniref:hypothetical protein n=1 Tax=Klebsiella pneumoniae TaxID=573 RepID=UPI000E2CBC34|nr:hypothetical protein [Klebsiella pneumoniae]SYE15243.1 RelE family toxin-antitoxin system [Klebsiella pneumoniae]
MTDITELAQREKFEAWFKSSFHPDKTGPYIKDQLYFAWKAAGAELVEVLEKAQTKADVYDMLRDDYGLREKGVGLADFVDWQAKRIAELESRTVKMPEPFKLAKSSSGLTYYFADDVDAALTDAGIKVEAE